MYSHNQVTDPITGSTYDIRGHDNAAQAQITFGTNQANQILAKQQNDWNVEQWHRQNEYNSPANQVKLMQDAGLNPNSWSNAGSTAGAITSADMATAQAPQLTNHDSDRIQNALNAVQLGMNAGDTVMGALQKRVEMENMRAQIAESKQRQRLFDATFDNQVLLSGSLLDESRGRYNALQQQAGKTYEEAESIKQTRRIESEMWDDQHKLNAKQWKKLTEEIRGLTADADLKEFEAKFRKEYGISPSADWLTNLIQISLSSPQVFDNIVDRLSQNMFHIGSSVWSWLNPWSKD